jgi:hypothetical protein
MNPFGSVLTVALRLGRAFDAVGIPYYIGGSVASSIIGEQRFTNDIDIAVMMTDEQIAPFTQQLGSEFDVDELSLHEELRRRGSWNIIHRSTGLKIDLFFSKHDSLDCTSFNRRRAVEVNAAGERLYLPTAEDMILRKMLWFIDGGQVSERQWRDVIQMMRLVGPNLDNPYLDQWADWLDLQKLLGKARQEVANPPLKLK